MFVPPMSLGRQMRPPLTTSGGGVDGTAVIACMLGGQVFNLVQV